MQCWPNASFFRNELPRLAEQVGIDIEMVRHGINSDPRSGLHFYIPGGLRWVERLPRTLKYLPVLPADGCAAAITAVGAVNERRTLVVVDKIV